MGTMYPSPPKLTSTKVGHEKVCLLLNLWLWERNGKFKFKNEFSQVLRLSLVELKAWQSIMAFFMVKNIKFDFSQPHTPSTVAFLFIYIVSRPPHTNQTNQKIKINGKKKENSIKIKWKRIMWSKEKLKKEEKRKSDNEELNCMESRKNHMGKCNKTAAP